MKVADHLFYLWRALFGTIHVNFFWQFGWKKHITPQTHKQISDIETFSKTGQTGGLKQTK